jgi:hypothetical protein
VVSSAPVLVMTNTLPRFHEFNENRDVLHFKQSHSSHYLELFQL